MDSAQMKRMILDKSESTGIRRKLVEQKETGITQDDVVEMGGAFEQMVAMKGWAFIEAYLLRKCDPTVLLFGQEDPVQRGEARGAVNLLQYVDQTIRAKNEILRKANADTE